MIKQTSITIRRYLCWTPFFLVLLFLFVQLMPRALGQREVSNKSSDTDVPSSIQASISSPLGDPRGVCTGYVIGQISGDIVPGTVDIGNHCDDCETLISLPFPFALYDQSFTQVYVSSNGRLDFVTSHAPLDYINTCLPAPPVGGSFDYTIFAYWDDLRTDVGLGGISTSVSGAAPHRIFNIEFKTVYRSDSQIAHFEVRLYEDQARFDVIHSFLFHGNTTATAGVQRNNANFTQHFCNGSGGPGTISGQRYVLSSTAQSYDLNHNGKPDYLLYNGSIHQTAAWYMNNNVFAGSAYGPTLPTGWNVIDVADFDGDGNLDYALFNPSTRQTAIWYLSGVTFITGAYGPTLPSGWAMVATADFDFNCQPDYLLYNTSTRQTAVWYMNNNVFTGSAYGPTLPAGWKVAGVSDFNQDGFTDYLLFNATTRQTAIWYMNNNVFVSSAYGPTIASGYQLQGTADFNGDGKPDYLLYNPSTRQTAIWYLNNNIFTGSAYGPILPTGWNLVAL